MNRRIAIVAFVFCLIVFSFGLVQLLKLRFQGGDVYPPYSSLRADPLGSMAFFEALERMPDISVRRDFSADNRLPEGKATTYLHLGAPSREWEWIRGDELRTIEDFVTSGGRLVVAFAPGITRPLRLFSDAKEDEADPNNKKKADEKAAIQPGEYRGGLSHRIRHLCEIFERHDVHFPTNQAISGIGPAALSSSTKRR